MLKILHLSEHYLSVCCIPCIFATNKQLTKQRNNKKREKAKKQANKKILIMEKYFVNGKEISKEQADEIKKRNLEYIESGNFELIAKCEFVVVIK